MFSRINIFSFATIVVGASATGIFRQFSSNNGVSDTSSSIEDLNPCHVTCSREYSPICATDAETYGNACLFGIAKCINKDLQLVANVTCPEFLSHLSQVTHKRVLEGPNSLNSTYGSIGNLTKNTTDIISSALSSIPIIKIPSLNLPLFGIPSNPSQLLKPQTSTTTTTTTTTTAATQNDSLDSEHTTKAVESEDGVSSTELLNNDDNEMPTTEYANRSDNETSTSTSSPSDLEETSTSTSTSTSTPTPVSSKSSLFEGRTKSFTGRSRKMTEVRSSSKDDNSVISNVAKTLQSTLNIGSQDGKVLNGNNNGNGILGNSGLILSNLDDTKATVQGMIKTIPYVPGKENSNSTNISIVEELSSIIKLPNGTFEGKGLLLNSTNNGTLNNIIERKESRNITTNLTDLIPSIKNITSVIMETSVLNDSDSAENDSPVNGIPQGKLDTSEVVKNLSSSLSNIAKNIVQNEDQTQNTQESSQISE